MRHDEPMGRRDQTSRSAGAFAVVVLLVSACGGSKPSTTTPIAPGPSPVASPAPTSEVAATPSPAQTIIEWTKFSRNGEAVKLSPDLFAILKRAKSSVDAGVSMFFAEQLRTAILKDGVVDATEIDLLGELASRKVVRATLADTPTKESSETTLLFGKVDPMVAVYLSCIDVADPQLVNATSKTLADMFAKGGADSERARQVVRIRFADHLASLWETTRFGNDDSDGVRPFIGKFVDGLADLPDADAARMRKVLGQEFVAIDERTGGDAIKEVNYDWLLTRD